MKMSIRVALCGLLASFSTLLAQQGSSNRLSVEQEILAKEKEVWELSVREDWDGWSKLMAEDTLPVYSDGYASKAEVLQALHSSSDPQHSSNLHYSMDDVRVIPVGEAGLIVYKVSTDSKEGEKTVSRQFYVSSLWQKHEGKWLNRFWQETDTALPDDQRSKQALAKEREIQEAQKQGDWARFADLLSDDLVAIDEDGIRGKKELLEQIRTSDFHLSDYKMEDVSTIPEGNGAIVAYKQTHIGTERGKPFALHINTHSNWQKRGDKWVLTMFQDSTAKEDTPANDVESDEPS